MPPVLFSMSTSSSSRQYTPHALRSFFANTGLREGDEFLLVDNDGDFDEPWLKQNFPQVRFIRRKRKASFSENANLSMAHALQRGADLFFMNNDIIFTPHWDEPLRAPLPTIMTPTCNQNYFYSGPKLELKPVMVLDEYLGNEEEFLSLVQQHLSSPRNYVSAYKTNFYCVKIPLVVYSRVGGFDTRFKIAGGEDDDYSARAHLLGFSVTSADQSYLLHFGGRSTWSGLESRAEWQAREQRFVTQFAEKWGPTLAKFLLTRDRNIVDMNPSFQQAEQRYGIPGVLKAMIEYDGIKRPQLQSPIDPGIDASEAEHYGLAVE